MFVIARASRGESAYFVVARGGKTPPLAPPQHGGARFADARNRLAAATLPPTLAAMDFWRGWPYPVAVAALFVVVLLRAGATYALGRAAQEGVRQRPGSPALMAKPRLRPGAGDGRPLGAPVVALSFLTVGIQTLVNLAAGVTRMPLRRYLPALTVGR